jgi:O-antigen/teichoic acid export membrane protein
MLYMKSDQVMLEWLRGPAEVGQYSVAVRIAESLYFLPVILSNTFLPRIGRGTGRYDSDVSLRQLFRSAWFLGVGMAVASMLLLPPLVPIVFGEEFIPAQAALISLGPAAFAVATGCASDAWLNTQGYQKIIAWRSAVGALVNVFLNLMLIPRMGFVGAAMATSASYVVSVYIVGVFHESISVTLVNLIFPFKHGTR